MYTITKEFHFCASHVLEGLEKDHPCARLHGHNYVLKVELKSDKLNDVGFIKDYRALQPVKEYVDEVLDHRHLNDVFVCNPTAENMAKELFYIIKKHIPELSAVELSETPKTNARYEPSTNK